MSKKGIIIRLVDIVLNLLFGFITISEVSRQSKIDIAKTSEFQVERLDKEEVVFIAITNDGKYLVEDEQVVINEEKFLQQYIIQKLTELKSYKGKDAKMRVRIRSNWDAPIKYSLYVSAICDVYGIQKGVDVKRVNIK